MFHTLGKKISEANQVVMDTLNSKNLLMSKNKYRHSFPHCWRHKTPIFFRATPQWFISMDKNDLLDNCLKKIDEINWLPEWGKSRINSMLSDSQIGVFQDRDIGSSYPLFVNKETGKLHKDTLKIIEKVAEKIEKSGAESWFLSDPVDFLGAEANEYEKITDTLDVWFDSGVTHFSCSRSTK